MFGVFIALTRHEALPQTEQVRKDLWKRLRRRAASPIAVIATLRVLLLSWLGPGRRDFRRTRSPRHVSGCIPGAAIARARRGDVPPTPVHASTGALAHT
jgi:hypothetical protein